MIVFKRLGGVRRGLVQRVLGFGLANLCLLVVGCILGIGPRAGAQCPPGWLPGEGIPGVYMAGFQFGQGTIYGMTLWDPDGPGPRPAVLVAGGTFRIAGKVLANNIATWDGNSWSALGTGIDGITGANRTPTVNALTTLPNGAGGNDLIVGGDFNIAGGVPASRVARWNGSSWSALGAGTDETVNSLIGVPDGNGGTDLILGGSFGHAGGVATRCIARWHSGVWSALGVGVNNRVMSMAIMPSGDLIAGGDFTTAGGVASQGVARWNGSLWSPLGTSMNGNVNALVVLGNGDLVAGGSFTTAGGVAARRIARWNGAAWSALGTGMNDRVNAMCLLPSGDLIATGQHTNAGGVAAFAIARWNGTNWSAVGSGLDGWGLALAVMPGGDFVAGGQFEHAGGLLALRIARWGGGAWSAMGTGQNKSMGCYVTMPNGDFIGGGLFTFAGSTTQENLAVWNGVGWSRFPSGIIGFPSYAPGVGALAVMPNGDLLAGGRSPSGGVYRWNGHSWSALGASTDRSVAALAVMPNGDVVAGGSYLSGGGANYAFIDHWNGTGWVPMGSGIVGANGGYPGVFCLQVMPNGDLIAAGTFITAGGVAATNIARWNGQAWFPLGSGLGEPGGYDGVLALQVLSNGDLIAGGSFSTAGGAAASGIARWDGSAWWPLGAGVAGGSPPNVQTLCLLPDGDLIAGGNFSAAGGIPAGSVARWSGGMWTPLGTGMTSEVDVIGRLPNGDLLASGAFTSAGAFVTGHLARYSFEEIPPPSIGPQPAGSTACRAGAAAFNIGVTADASAGVLSYRWEHENPPASGMWSQLFDGTIGGIGTVGGSTSKTLTIQGLGVDAPGRYRCVVSSACGDVVSDAATLVVCVADFNCDGAADFFDYDEFVVCFEGGDCPSGTTADVDGDGAVDFFDYDAFVVAFESPC